MAYIQSCIDGNFENKCIEIFVIVILISSRCCYISD